MFSISVAEYRLASTAPPAMGCLQDFLAGAATGGYRPLSSRPHLRTTLIGAVPESAPSVRKGVPASFYDSMSGADFLGASRECLREGQEVDYE